MLVKVYLVDCLSCLYGVLYLTIILSPEVEVTSGGYLLSRRVALVTDTEGDNCFSIWPVSE